MIAHRDVLNNIRKRSAIAITSLPKYDQGHIWSMVLPRYCYVPYLGNDVIPILFRLSMWPGILGHVSEWAAASLATTESRKPMP